MHGVRETEQRNREKKQLKKKKNRRVSSNFTPLTDEKEEKSLQSKKLNYFVRGVRHIKFIYHSLLERERERDDDDEKNV